MPENELTRRRYNSELVVILTNQQENTRNNGRYEASRWYNNAAGLVNGQLAMQTREFGRAVADVRVLKIFPTSAAVQAGIHVALVLADANIIILLESGRTTEKAANNSEERQQKQNQNKNTNFKRAHACSKNAPKYNIIE